MEISKIRTGIFCFIIILLSSSVNAQADSIDINTLEQEISELRSNQNKIKNDVIELTRSNNKSLSLISALESANKELYLKIDSTQKEIYKLFNNQQADKLELLSAIDEAVSRISMLEFANKELYIKIDSIRNEYNKLSENQQADKTELSASINQTNDKVQATEDILSSRTIWGIGGVVLLLIALAAVCGTFMKKFKSGTTSIDDVRKAQDSLKQAQENIRKAQEKMQEETIQLDNKLIEILTNQPVPVPTDTGDGEIDHSLTLKVADEIVRIEANLSRMDSTIKGHKQLSKAVERIKDNFKANDYEIVDMLGKPYHDGMKVIATFIPDETLEPGQQIISRIIKPQVNYKQVMIQAAQIEVRQSE